MYGKRTVKIRVLLLVIGVCLIAAESLPAQEVVVERSSRSARPASASQPAGKPVSGQPSTEKDSKTAEKADEKDKKESNNKEASPKTITRSDYKPDPLEQPVPIDLNAEGTVKFNFHGTPWPVVLDWLARYSHLNLDWQELPGDYVNLRTQRAYTDLEARDMINRHLLARGYTLLVHDELLTVAKIATLNPGLVPRVQAEDLNQCLPHEFVKVSLPLDWILADEAVEQLKPMLSPNGKLHAITSINRLEAVDVAANLQEVYNLLTNEQSKSNSDGGLVREFKLEHVRAVDVIGSLYGILGLRKPQSLSGGSNDISGSSSMQIMQQLQRMQQQQQQRGNSSGDKGKEETEPKLVLNERENSILAHASPDKMEIIAQTIKAMDVASDPTKHILQNLDGMKVYRLSTLKPDPLVKILSEIGDLSPTSKIQVDSENNAIIVHGTLADHVTIQSLVDRLDGSSRQFHVVTLRRLRARDVAGTIQYMLGEEEEEEDNSRSRYYGYYGSYRGNQSETTKDKRPFRVDADVENNRLLVWANESERGEIDNLLIKMGEFPAGKANPARSRTVDLYSDENAERLLEEVERVWQRKNQNQLNIESSKENSEKPAAQKPIEQRQNEVLLNSNTAIHFASEMKTADLAPTELAQTQPVQTPAEESELAQRPQLDQHPLAEPEVTPAPITIRQLPDGRIQIRSEDTEALDELEYLISELAPKSPDYKIYQIKYAWPFGVELLLDDFFTSEEDEEEILDWFGNTRTFNKQSPDRLSTQRKLKIISDDDSRTLLVQGATAQQLAIIEELLEIYDRPESSDPQSIRVTKIYHIEFSQAAVISETVKAVYRDLLSANDPALQTKGKDGQNQQQPSSQGITFAPFRNNEEKKEADQPQEPIKFKGLLSIGVDEVSNTLVVSAASGLIEGITELIETLDVAAKPDNSVKVLSVNPAISPSFLRDRLHQSFGIGGKLSVSTTGANRKGKSDNANPANPQSGQNNNAQPSSE